MFYELKNPVSADFFKKHNHINIHFPAHIHYCFEFLAASEGTLQIIVDGKSQIIHPGEAAVIFPNQLHSLDSLQDGDYLICLFSPDLVQAYFRKYASRVPETNLMKLNSFYMQRFCRIQEDLERENDITDENTIFEIKGLLYSICGEFDKQTVYRSAGTSCDDLLLREIFQYIEQNYRSDCLLSDLAKTIGYEYENVNPGTVEPTEYFGEKVSGENHFLKGSLLTDGSRSLCRLVRSIIPPSLLHRSQSSVCRVNPSQIVVINIPVNHAPHLCHGHLRRVHPVEFFFLKCRKKTLHSRIVVTSARSAHALDCSVFS